MMAVCQVMCGDALLALREIPSRSVRLVLTSPPYNIGKPYEKRVAIDDYLATQRLIVGECARIVVSGGSVCWQVGNYVEDGEVIPLDALLIPILREAGFKIRNRVIWSFGHGQHCKRRLSGRHETVVWATLGDGYVFELDSIRIPQTYPSKKAYKGPRKGLPSGNPLGKNPGDVWEIPNIKFNHPEKTAHPCQFPERLVERLVSSLSLPGELVVDPYCGSGTTGVVSRRLGRRSILIDLDPGYAEMARERIGLLSPE